MLTHTLDSHVAREVQYDPASRVMVIDFAKPGMAPKRYRYFDVPEVHFETIRGLKTKGESEGSYILKHLVCRKASGPHPYRFEKIDG